MPVCFPRPRAITLRRCRIAATLAVVVMAAVGCGSTKITPSDAPPAVASPTNSPDNAPENVTAARPEPGRDAAAGTAAAGGRELTPAQLVVATAADPLADPDARREALLTITNSTAAGEPVYLEFYRALLADASLDPTVATAALAALALHGQPQDAGLALPWLDSNEDFARWQSAVSLQRFHHPPAVPALIRKTTDDTDADVRMAAVTALGQYPRRDVFDALVIALDDRDYGVARAAREALQRLTDYDAGDDPRAWLDHADANPATFLASPRNYTYHAYPGNPSLPLFWVWPDPVPQTPIGYAPPRGVDE